MKNIIITSFTLFIISFGYSQNEFLDYIVTKEGDTIYGKIG
jgi:hypothetical protein